jgi:hypothetical protein
VLLNYTLVEVESSCACLVDLSTVLLVYNQVVVYCFHSCLQATT